MAEKQEKTPEQIAAEKRQRARAKGNAISHLGLKLGMISSDMPIEEQMKTLLNYHEVPSIEDIKSDSNNLDSYRLDFMNNLYNQYFVDYPEMLERLGDKKSDNNQLNFHFLQVMEYIVTPKDLNKETREAYITAYYNILPEYKKFLINYIINNQRWDLTTNSQEAFISYADIINEHDKLLKQYPNPGSQITSLIKEVHNLLFEKIINLKTTGLDIDTYKATVSDVIIGKFLALSYMLNSTAGSGYQVLYLYSNVIFREYSINDVYSFACEVEEKLSLDEDQQKHIDETKKILDLLRKQNIGGSSSRDSGCFSILLLMLIPASIFAYMLI